MVLNPVVPNIIYSVCNTQHHAQNAEHYTNIPATMQQPLFKFCSAAAFHSGATGLITHGTLSVFCTHHTKRYNQQLFLFKPKTRTRDFQDSVGPLLNPQNKIHVRIPSEVVILSFAH
jgi:hypothetical protein